MSKSGTADDRDVRAAWFRDVRDAYRRELFQFGMFVELYRYLHERTRDQLHAMNRAPAFFQTVLIALKSAIVVHGYALVVGSRKEEQSFSALLSFVSKNLDLFSGITHASVRADRKRVEGLTAIDSLRFLRNKLHAHLDVDYFVTRRGLSERAPWTWGDLREFRETLVDLVNKYSRAFDRSTMEFRPFNADDVQIVLDALGKRRATKSAKSTESRRRR